MRVPHPVQYFQDGSILMATDFLHAAKMVTDSSGISLGCHLSLHTLCPVFPLVWMGIRLKIHFIELNAE